MKHPQLIATVALILIVPVGADAADDGNKSSWAETMTAVRAVYLQSPEAKLASVSDSLFKPFDSGSIDGNGPAKQVVVDVSGLKELRLVAICERGPANCNIWGEPKLIAKDGTVTRLTDLKPTSVSVGWGQLLVNKNWNDHPLIVGDRQFEFGFWVHANSELTFALDGKYERFEALVGEDKDRLGGLVRFKVLSTPVPLPTAWADLARDFPLQAGWLRTDAGADGLAAWFGPARPARSNRRSSASRCEKPRPIRRCVPNSKPWSRPRRAPATPAGSTCTPESAALGIARRCSGR